MPQKSIKRARLTSEPLSTNWFDLPLEMREMVIDRMDSKTRCRFAECSKLCEEEAKSSKNYLKSIRIERGSNPELYIGHDNFESNYCLEFVDVQGLIETQSIVIYKTNRTESKYPEMTEYMEIPGFIKWTKIKAGKAEDVRMRYLYGFVKKYEKSITEITVDDKDFKLDRLNIKQLKNLKFIGGNHFSDFITREFLDLTQILHADVVDLMKTHLSFDQALQFRGSHLTFATTEFDENQIRRYLKWWKNGELHENMKFINVGFECVETVFGRNIIEGLDVFDFREEIDGGVYEWSFNFCSNHQTELKCHYEVFYSAYGFSILTVLDSVDVNR